MRKEAGHAAMASWTSKFVETVRVNANVKAGVSEVLDECWADDEVSGKKWWHLMRHRKNLEPSETGDGALLPEAGRKLVKDLFGNCRLRLVVK